VAISSMAGDPGACGNKALIGNDSAISYGVGLYIQLYKCRYGKNAKFS